MTRRDLIRYLLATPIAATVDVEQLLWVPKPIVVVPAMPDISWPHYDLHQLYWDEVNFPDWETYNVAGWSRWVSLDV